MADNKEAGGFGMKTISIHKHPSPDWEELAATMLGRDVQINDKSGEMVYKPGTPAVPTMKHVDPNIPKF